MAEKYFVLASRPQDAVDMYTKANKWEKAHAIATSYMSTEEVAFLYVSQARDMEAEGCTYYKLSPSNIAVIFRKAQGC